MFSDANGFTRKPPYSLRMTLDLCHFGEPIRLAANSSLSSALLLTALLIDLLFPASCYILISLVRPLLLCIGIFLSSPLSPFSLVVQFGWEEARSLWPSAQNSSWERSALPQCLAPQANSSRPNVKHLKFFSCFTLRMFPPVLWDVHKMLNCFSKI